MKGLLRTLAILACLTLAIQTVRHSYLLWFASHSSVLTAYDRPMAAEIGAAQSVEELVRRYDPIRKQVDAIRAKRAAEPVESRMMPRDEFEAEPFKSERELREAITIWEGRERTIHELRYYWSIGLVFAALGMVLYLVRRRWLGITFAATGLAEMIYWTSPEFLSSLMGRDAEFDRLLINKFVLSVAAAVVLAVGIRIFKVFEENPPAT